MTLRNAQIAALLRRYASILALQEANPHQVRAYRRGADSLESAEENVAELIARGGSPQDLPAIGKGLDSLIRTIVAAGEFADLTAAEQSLPPEQRELLNYPKLNAQDVLKVYRELGISSVGELQSRSTAGEILRVCGGKLHEQIRQGLDRRPRMLVWKTEPLVQQIETRLRAIPGVTRVERTGSLRRRRETVGELDFLVAAKTPQAVFESLRESELVQSVEVVGKQACTCVLSGGRLLQVRCAGLRQWGTALASQTGSAAHLEQLQALAAEKGGKGGATLPACADEAKLYARLGLEFVPPELREGRGEVEAARAGKLPQLIERADIRGDLHMHTTESDGGNSLEEMAEAAQSLGYQYIAITDHSQSLKLTNGLSPERLLQQARAIDQLNTRLSGFTVLKSSEVDILEDGTLDYPPEILKELDLTVCSIHSKFQLDQTQQTERILRAMDNPYFRILGHATGRMLLRRPGYEVDMERILKHALERGVFLEINSNPNRLDLSAEHARLAKEMGVKLAINTDAHSVAELQFLSAGVDQGRRGWLERADVLNTRPLDELRKLLRRP